VSGQDDPARPDPFDADAAPYGPTVPATSAGPRVVALGGGHGLAAALGALRRVTTDLPAVVTVADDGGSSGRLRRELGVLPPGDLRMALASLCGDDAWGRTWAQVLQHRFSGGGELHGHAVGNLLIVALWDLLGEHVEGLELVGRLLGARGRVLPMAAVPLDIEALVGGLDPAEPRALTTVVGQVEVATTPGRIVVVQLRPPRPPAHPAVLEAVREADWVVLGPGSWFTSVIPHLLVPELAAALADTRARRLVTVNLGTQVGETDGYTPMTHLEVLAAYAPELRLDVVLADPSVVEDVKGLARLVQDLGGELVLADVAAPDGSARHDEQRLAEAFRAVFADGPPGDLAVGGSRAWR
jgi:uncharacterized cofD-like protein